MEAETNYQKQSQTPVHTRQDINHKNKRQYSIKYESCLSDKAEDITKAILNSLR